MTYKLKLDELPAFVSRLVPAIKERRIVALSGDLGVGKTTFVRQLCAQLGVSQTVQSPTFAYVNVYHAADGTPIYHFDLHRLTSAEDFFAAGFDEYLANSDALVLIEWPEVISSYLPANALWLRFAHVGLPDVRRVQIAER